MVIHKMHEKHSFRRGRYMNIYDSNILINYVNWQNNFLVIYKSVKKAKAKQVNISH